MKRSEFYREAFANLGPLAVAQRTYAKAISRAPLLKLTSKYLDQPVYGRRGTTDLMVFDLIFVEREYRCLDNTKDIRTIVDAGANCGYSSAYLLSRYPDSRAVCIEPDERNFELLRRNLAPFGKRVDFIKGALWSEQTQLKFDEDSTGSNNEWGRRTVEPEAGAEAGLVDAIDIPTLMSRYGLESIDLLKIDIEGAEEAVFSADTRWLDRVRNIVVELHSDGCRAAFMQAIAQRDYAVSSCGELTVCLSGT